MLSKRSKNGYWYTLEDQPHKFSGPFFLSLWWVYGERHRLYGIQSLRLKNWSVNDKALSNIGGFKTNCIV